MELDPLFLKALTLLHSRHPDSGRQLKALVQEVRDKQRGDNTRPVIERKENPDKNISKNVDRINLSGNGKSISVSVPTTITTTTSTSDVGVTETLSKSTAYELVETVEELSSSSFADNGSHAPVGHADDDMEELTTEMMEGISEIESGFVEAIEELSSASCFEPTVKKPRRDSSSTSFVKERESPPVAVEDPNEALPIDDSSQAPFDDGPTCSVCNSHGKDSPDNCLVECHECHGYYHQRCHKPQVSNKDVHDPRLVWYCSKCTREMKREIAAAQKSTISKAKPEQPAVKSIPINPFQSQKPSVLPFRRPIPSAGETNKNSSSSASTTSSISSNNTQSSSGQSKSPTSRSRPQEATMKSMKRLEMVKKRAKLQQQMRKR